MDNQPIASAGGQIGSGLSIGATLGSPRTTRSPPSSSDSAIAAAKNQFHASMRRCHACDGAWPSGNASTSVTNARNMTTYALSASSASQRTQVASGCSSFAAPNSMKPIDTHVHASASPSHTSRRPTTLPGSDATIRHPSNAGGMAVAARTISTITSPVPSTCGANSTTRMTHATTTTAAAGTTTPSTQPRGPMTNAIFSPRVKPDLRTSTEPAPAASPDSC